MPVIKFIKGHWSRCLSMDLVGPLFQKGKGVGFLKTRRFSVLFESYVNRTIKRARGL